MTVTNVFRILYLIICVLTSSSFWKHFNFPSVHQIELPLCITGVILSVSLERETEVPAPQMVCDGIANLLVLHFFHIQSI